jgi:pimeloyl-ACP methyl ester carboxylesterase
MHSPRRRSLGFRPSVRIAALAAAAALLVSCGTTISGSALIGSNPLATGQITEPSALPGDRTAAEPTAPTGVTTVPGSATAPSTGAPGTGQVPSGLERFYTQTLAWGACGSFATDADTQTLYQSPEVECARLTVPLAYDRPAGQTVTMGVLRKVATDPTARIGSLVVDPGGPGGSGMAFIASYATSGLPIIADLNARFDLVGIDPRGVGSSLPAVRCQTDAQKDAVRAHDQRSRTKAEVDAANALTRQLVAACLANTGKDQGIDGKTFLANVGTRDVAKDLDVLRAALGDRKLTYLGFSYGTQIGWEYAEQFPQNVRAILFDGDMNPDQDPATLILFEYKAFQGAFDNFARWCVQNADPCALGTDHTKAVARFHALTRPLLDHPVKLSDGRSMGFSDAVLGTVMALYYDQYRPRLAKALADLAAGDGDALMALADEYDQRDASGHYSNEQDALTAVDCVDAPRMSDPADVTKFNTALAAAAPFMDDGDPAGAVLDPCAMWPVPPTLLPHKLHITGLPKTLVVSTTGDPATPYQNGVELAKELGAALVTVKGVRHTSFLGNGVKCVDDIGVAYLMSLKLPASDPVCS